MTSQDSKFVSDAASVAPAALAILRRLGVTDAAFAKDGLPARSPVTGETMATLRANYA